MARRQHVSGLRELDAALGELPKASAKGVLRRVGLKSLQPIADDMRSGAPNDPDTGANDLRSSVGVGTKLSPRQAKLNRAAIKAGADKSFVEVYAGAGPLPQAHLTEFGSVNNKPVGWARRAWDSGKAQVLEAIKKDLGGEIIKTAKRVAKRAAAKAAKGG